MSYIIKEYKEDSIELNSFIHLYLDSSFIISTKNIINTINNLNIYNLKTRNFKQDIAYIIFISDLLILDSIYITLKDFVLKQDLKNYIFIIYFNNTNIFITKGYNSTILFKNTIYKDISILSLFKDTLKLEGYIFKENKSKNSI